MSMTSDAPTVGTETSATRDLLESTALDLFDRHGFDSVTTSQIAKAAGFSPRTYFRYFTSKHDPLFQDPQPWLADLLGLLRRQPRELDPVTALHAALAEDALSSPMSDDDIRRKRIVRTTPSLAHKVREFDDALEETLAVWLAERTGRRSDDLEVEVVAAQLVAARRVVARKWLESNRQDSMLELTARAFAVIDVRL